MQERERDKKRDRNIDKDIDIGNFYLCIRIGTEEDGDKQR